VRRKKDSGLASILVAPIVCILPAGVLNEPVADIEAFVGEIIGLPDSETVGITTEVLLRVLGVAHWWGHQALNP
jgi:hypothetical protein